MICGPGFDSQRLHSLTAQGARAVLVTELPCHVALSCDEAPLGRVSEVAELCVVKAQAPKKYLMSC